MYDVITHSFSIPLTRYRVIGSLEPMPGDLGQKAGYTSDRVQSITGHKCIHTHLITHKMPISSLCMSRYCGRKPTKITKPTISNFSYFKTYCKFRVTICVTAPLLIYFHFIHLYIFDTSF